MTQDSQPDVQPVPTDAEKYGVEQEPATKPNETNSVDPGSTDGSIENGGGQ